MFEWFLTISGAILLYIFIMTIPSWYLAKFLNDRLGGDPFGKTGLWERCLGRTNSTKDR